MIHVAPSLLACDFAHLADEIRRAEDAGADSLHVDVMDGHFVRNITIGPLIVEAAKRSTRLELNVHLMIDYPERYIESFAKAGADWILVHPEARGDVPGALDAIRAAGCRRGIALNPETAVSDAASYLSDIEFLLIMSVHPGWGGQAFMSDVLPKVAQARPRCGAQTMFGIDGGINGETAKDAVRAGITYLVAGTYLFRSEDMAGRIRALQHVDEGTA